MPGRYITIHQEKCGQSALSAETTEGLSLMSVAMRISSFRFYICLGNRTRQFLYLFSVIASVFDMYMRNIFYLLLKTAVTYVDSKRWCEFIRFYTYLYEMYTVETIDYIYITDFLLLTCFEDSFRVKMLNHNVYIV